jgi:hypothetical protein
VKEEPFSLKRQLWARAIGNRPRFSRLRVDGREKGKALLHGLPFIIFTIFTVSF